jgi:hypothetical protein
LWKRSGLRLDEARALMAARMSIIAQIMNSKTGTLIQKMPFTRMPKPWISFNLASGEAGHRRPRGGGQARAGQVHHAGGDLGHPQGLNPIAR